MVNEYTVPYFLGTDNADILARITPSRTRALGAVYVSIESGFSSELNMSDKFGYGGNNYDHSAQFLSNYHVRHTYWDELI